MPTTVSIPENKPGAAQDLGTSTPPLYPNESTDDASSMEYAVGVNPPKPRSDHPDRTWSLQTGIDLGDPLHRHTAAGRNDFNSCDRSTNQGQWNNFTLLNSPKHCDWSVFNIESGGGVGT